ncbi:MAG: hypothetical protein JF597_25955 [Streptomyces sp.]|uniref:hypothetical protein n=1 Tax=Streptomyces sp. TaxID=1931 RepID=UPI0025F0E94B|nr:hypothetical protein [Streptomyces sp.]MBW8796917.1 hypothetical protein [Streptomyces sp.]
MVSETPLSFEEAPALDETIPDRAGIRSRTALAAAEQTQRRADSVAERLVSSRRLVARSDNAGLPKEARASPEESTSLCRRPATKDPAAYALDLAVALHDLGNPLGAVGRHTV